MSLSPYPALCISFIWLLPSYNLCNKPVICSVNCFPGFCEPFQQMTDIGSRGSLVRPSPQLMISDTFSRQIASELSWIVWHPTGVTELLGVMKPIHLEYSVSRGKKNFFLRVNSFSSLATHYIDVYIHTLRNDVLKYLFHIMLPNHVFYLPISYTCDE